jgi:trans-aconitate 2-methyltransferase
VNGKFIFWDADACDNFSNAQEKWANIPIHKRKCTGKENILDAGCGSWRITKILSKIITDGKIYAVDNDSNMIKKARENLGVVENVKLVQTDLLNVGPANMPTKFDAIFSNAVLHRVMDRYKVFENSYSLLNPGGEIMTRCWGYGNLKKTLPEFDAVRSCQNLANLFLSGNLPELCKTCRQKIP